MDFIRNQITDFRNDHNHDDNSNNNSNNNNNQQQNQQQQSIDYGNTIDIAPGQVEEAVHYMTQNGNIDLSFLRFQMKKRYNEGGTSGNSQIQNYGDNYGGTGNVDLHYHYHESFLDIAVFEVPENHCTSRNCDLSKYGIGSLAHFKGSTYLNLCQAGRLVLDHNIYKGYHTQLMIPAREGSMPNHVKNGGTFSVPKNKYYEVMIANCNQSGQHVHVTGQVVFDFQENGYAGSGELTNTTFALLVSLACMVFLTFSLLSVRINWGTRADFERTRGFFVSVHSQHSHVHDHDDTQVPTVENDDTSDEEDQQEPDQVHEEAEEEEGNDDDYNDEREHDHEGETRFSLNTILPWWRTFSY